jgi:acetolactate synthase-1/2/3 large subunit
MSKMRLSGAQIVWKCLEHEGVDTVFGYPGGCVLPLYDALQHTPSIHHVLVRHEQGAAHMADGYSRATGKVGVALATSGPGATNLVTGIATAMLDSSPVVCLTGQVGSKFIGTDAFQEIDITGITMPITKHNYMVTDVNDIARTLREAFIIARTGRPGPVLVDITKDAQMASCEFEWESAVPQLRKLETWDVPDSKRLAEAAELINKAERPVILAGHGILMSGAMLDLQLFAEASDIPVGLTLLGLGAIPHFHPLCLGMMGMHGEAWLNHAIQNADLLIALGMRFDDRVTGKLDSYAPNAKKIHVDIDASEIHKNVRADVAIVGDLKQVLPKLTPMLTPMKRSKYWGEINDAKGAVAVRDIRNLPDTGHLYAAHVIHDLWRETKGKALIVTDVGQHQMWEAQYYHHSDPRSLITSGGLGTMGFALPAAIGAKFSRPDADVWVIVGDGGFQMTMAELATIVQENIKVNIAIINNGYLGMVRQWQEFFYERNYAATPLVNPDFTKIAEAYGILTFAVTHRDAVAPTVQKAREHPGPVLIDFRVEQEDSVYPMVPAGSALHEMIRRPSAIVETADE